MLRDFSTSAQQRLMSIVDSEAANDQWWNVPNWAIFKGAPELRDECNDIEQYHKTVIDWDYNSRAALQKVFNRLYEVDVEYAWQFGKHVEELQPIRNEIETIFGIDPQPSTLKAPLPVVNPISHDTSAVSVGSAVADFGYGLFSWLAKGAKTAISATSAFAGAVASKAEAAWFGKLGATAGVGAVLLSGVLSGTREFQISGDLSDSFTEAGISVTSSALGGGVGILAGSAATAALAGASIGTFVPIPVVGTVVGAAVGIGVGMLADWAFSAKLPGGKSLKDEIKEDMDAFGDVLSSGVQGGVKIVSSTAVAAGKGVSDMAVAAYDAVTDFGRGVGSFFSNVGQNMSRVFSW
jgi:hypothetical protein